jgi:hypothetical protein
MTTRRDLIKLASALGLAGATPTMADRIAAMTQLNQRASANVLLDPGAFAVDLRQQDARPEIFVWILNIEPRSS